MPLTADQMALSGFVAHAMLLSLLRTLIEKNVLSSDEVRECFEATLLQLELSGDANDTAIREARVLIERLAKLTPFEETTPP